MANCVFVELVVDNSTAMLYTYDCNLCMFCVAVLKGNIINKCQFMRADVVITPREQAQSPPLYTYRFSPIQPGMSLSLCTHILTLNSLNTSTSVYSEVI